MKKYLTVVLIPLIYLLTFPLLFSIINLFDIEVKSVFYLGSMIIVSIVTGFFLGLITDKKAFVKGILYGSVLSLIMFVTSLILKSKLSFYSLVYYLIIIVSLAFGSIIGITKKDK